MPHAEYERTVRLYNAGMSIAQVARVLGVWPNTVRFRLRQAARRFEHEAQKPRRITEPYGLQLHPKDREERGSARQESDGDGLLNPANEPQIG